jgi:HAD-superfamily phosphatase, subfamily IIIC/FkbH-like domain
MDKTELSDLLKKIRKYEKNLPDKYSLRIAVLGSYSIQYFVKMLRFYLAKQKIYCDIYEGEYNGINLDVFNYNSEFYRFKPDYVIILPFHEDIKNKPALLTESGQVKACMEDIIGYYKNLWITIRKLKECKILQSNIVLPPIRIVGNLEYQIESASNNFLRSINEMLVEIKPTYVTLIDAEALACNIGKYQWFDYSAYFLNKAGIRLEYMPEFVQLFVNQILALRGNIKKCLIMDLDNTLWGGIVGDDGWNGIQIDPNHAVGEAFRFFQKYILSLKERGVILAVCSKNEDNIAREPFERNENMLIHLDDISSFIANWDDKAGNIRKIASELNIGVDSLVFFDDNPAEREIVKQFIPEVHVVDVPTDPAQYVLQMEKESPFEWAQITKEDLDRTNSYLANRSREVLHNTYVNYDEYLQALEMHGYIGVVNESETVRFVQLINKSNQFNLRTIRYSEADIEQMISDINIRCLYAKLTDKFSNYGIISCVILKKQSYRCFIDTWVMSCRVLKRGVEYMMFEAIIKYAKDMGCTEITAEYIKTKKNSMVSSFYDTLGLENLCEENNDGEYRKKYVLKVLDNKFIYHIKKMSIDDNID